MSQGQDHSEFLATRMMERIGEQPDIALTAADLLRKDPYIERAEERVARIQETHGVAIADMYQFMGRVIGRSDAFSQINFDPKVRELAKDDQISKEQAANLITVGRKASDYDPNPARIMEYKTRSGRAHKLFLAAKLIVKASSEAEGNTNPPIALFVPRDIPGTKQHA